MSILDSVMIECVFASKVPTRSAQGLFPKKFLHLELNRDQPAALGTFSNRVGPAKACVDQLVHLTS
jgi:hypothetical protein